MIRIGRLAKRLGVEPTEEDLQKQEMQRRYQEQLLAEQQAYEEQLYQHYQQQQQQEQQQHYQHYRPQPYIPEPEESQEESYEEQYKDVPIKKALDIKKSPTPKGYFPTVISGIPVDLHSLEEYIVKTSPFAIKTLLRYDNARNIEDIKNYSTKTAGKKKADARFFLFLMLAIVLAVGGIAVIFFMPEILQMIQGIAP